MIKAPTLPLILLLAVTAFAATAPTHGAVAYQIKQYVIHNVTAGTALAPHLYDWYFNGSYSPEIIYYGYSYPQDNAFSGFTVAFRFKDYVYSTWRKMAFFKYDGVWAGLGQFGEGGSNDYYAQVSNGSLGAQSIGYGCNFGNPINWIKYYGDQWWYIGWSYDAVNGKLYGFRNANGVKLTISYMATGPAYGDLVGGFTEVYVSLAWNGYLSFIYLSSRVNETSIIFNESTVLDNSTIVLLDPTFFNGTNYFDLTHPNVYGIPKNDVYRIPANDTWLWVVNGLYNDSSIHFMWFPARTEVWVINASGAEVAHYIVPANVTYGFDFNVSVTAGSNYTVIINMPVPVEVSEPTQAQTASIGTFTFVVPNPSELLNPSNFMSWWVSQLGDLAFIIPLMIPATIYVKTRSAALTLEALVLMSIAVMWLAPTSPVLKVVVTAAGLALAAGIYRTVIRK